MEFTFTPGKFTKLRVVRTFHFGPLQQDLRENAVIEFDGSVVRIGDKTHSAPQLEAACRAGWLVVEGSSSAQAAPKPAGIQVHPAQSSGNTRGEAITVEPASEDERVVGSLGISKAKVEEALAKHNAAFNAVEEAPKAVIVSHEDPILEVQYPGVGNTPPLAKKFPTVRDDGAGHGGSMTRTVAGTGVQMGRAEQSSDGAAVGKFRTSNKHRTVLTDASDVDAEIARLDDPPPIEAQDIEEVPSSEGVTVAKVTPAVKKVVVTDASAVAREIAKLEDPPPPKTKKVAPVKATEEDIRSVGPGGATGDVSEARAGDDLADLLPNAATTGVPAPGIAGEGFSWDMNKHWKERVKIAVNKYGNDPSALDRILAVEIDSVKRHITSELARRSK